MIFDSMENANQYSGLHAGIDKMLEAMKAYTPQNYPVGRIELDGTRLFMMLNQYDTRDVTGAMSEAHRKYIDVMYMVEGEETIYVKDSARLKKITQEYNEQKDVLLAQTDEDVTPIHMTPGRFVVLFPQDAHTPNCHAQTPCNVKKIVSKVLIG